jgi:hypothetical protein
MLRWDLVFDWVKYPFDWKGGEKLDERAIEEREKDLDKEFKLYRPASGEELEDGIFMEGQELPHKGTQAGSVSKSQTSMKGGLWPNRKDALVHTMTLHVPCERLMTSIHQFYTPYSALRAFFLTSSNTLLISSTLGNVGCFKLSGSSIAKKSCDNPACPVVLGAVASASAVFAFFATSSSSISAFVRFFPFPFPFVAAGAGAGAGVSVDLDDEAGYGIDGGEISSMAAVRATAASHSEC